MKLNTFIYRTRRSGSLKLCGLWFCYMAVDPLLTYWPESYVQTCYRFFSIHFYFPLSLLLVRMSDEGIVTISSFGSVLAYDADYLG